MWQRLLLMPSVGRPYSDNCDGFEGRHEKGRIWITVVKFEQFVQ